MNGVRTLVWKEALVLRRDRRFLLYLFALPLAFSLLLSKGIGTIPSVEDGASQAVTGFTVMFTYWVVVLLGLSHFREHTWGVWSMVRVAGLRRWELLVGLLMPYFLLGVMQVTLLLAFGRVALGMRVEGSLLGLALLVITLELTTIGVGILLLNLVADLGTMMQLAQLFALLFAVFAGSLLPMSSLPEWCQVIAHGAPQFWALEGMRGVLAGQGFVDVLPNIAVLAAMGTALLVAGLLTFDVRKNRKDTLR